MKTSAIRLGLTVLLLGCFLCFGCGKTAPDAEAGPAKVLEAIPEYTAFPMDKVGPGNNE